MTTPNSIHSVFNGLIADALKHLNDRERHILTERKLKDEPVTLEVLSQHYGISRERVRQIEARAFEKLEKAIVRAAKTCGLADPCPAAG